MDSEIINNLWRVKQMTIEHTIQGFIVITDIIDDQFIQRKYMDYTISEAKDLFRNEFDLNDEEV
tara:strand:+ start:612 stop:803 length:192 start_codon:yes stop_codon:yes gene_type:complete